MEVQDLIEQVEKAGAVLFADGESLKVRRPVSVTLSDDLVSAIKEKKAAIIGLLRKRGNSTPEQPKRETTPLDECQSRISAAPTPSKTAKWQEAPSDPYHQRFEAALHRMNLSAGLRSWMHRERPDLDLQEQGLFTLAARLWQEHAPLEQFESILAEWVSCFRTAESFYRKSEDRSSERKSGKDKENF